MQGNLGLFDTAPDRRQVVLCLVLVGFLTAGTLSIFPIRNQTTGEVPAVVLGSDLTMLLFDLVTATMLLNQAFLFRSRALMFLGCGLIYGALLNIPRALTFPRLFSPGGLLGAGVNTTAWIAAIERMAFPSAILAYAWIRRSEGTSLAGAPPTYLPILRSIALTVALALLTTFLTTVEQAWLPGFFRDRTELASAGPAGLGLAAYVLTLSSLLVLAWNRKSMLDMWLLVALAGQAIQGLLVAALHARFTVGWYGLFALSVASRLALTLALLVESVRHYTSLAAARAMQDRQTDVRLMSMDAVAAAISHEVGQPLSAAMMGMTTAQKWLSSRPPQADKAKQALTASREAISEAFEVIKSTRSLFASGTAATAECDVNALLQRAASLLAREMTANKVALQIDAGANIPPVIGHPVQLQRVVVNLLTNAMEAFEGKRGGRRIGARTWVTDRGRVQIEISDNGCGIEHGDEGRLFDPFFTTKPSGTGLGLSLCRTIVEEHQGRIWAVAGGRQGATFCLELPPSRAPGPPQR